MGCATSSSAVPERDTPAPQHPTDAATVGEDRAGDRRRPDATSPWDNPRANPLRPPPSLDAWYQGSTAATGSASGCASSLMLSSSMAPQEFLLAELGQSTSVVEDWVEQQHVLRSRPFAVGV